MYGKKGVCFLFFLCLAFAMWGCARYMSSGKLDELPAIESFSSTAYEEYEFHFSPVKSAVLQVNGSKEVIKPDDPRLVRLLNFLAFSAEKGLSTLRQGYVMQDEIDGYLSSNEAMLEVTFSRGEASGTNILSNTPKIVVCGDSYILFVDSEIANNGIQGMHAERHWPYAVLVPVAQREEKLSYNGWGSGYWMDILEYCGFCTGYGSLS